jgi:hypothetical protein
MIQVALAIAAIGFRIHQFREELQNAPGFYWVGDVGLTGKIIIFLGVAAALLFHDSLWHTWINRFNRKTGLLSRPAIVGLGAT